MVKTYFPIGYMLLASVVLSIILSLVVNLLLQLAVSFIYF